MSKYEDSWERLDTEFDHFLLDMKPYVLKHPNKSERQRCAMWIKKLCDPAMCGSGLIGHKNRNMYARLLLHMLKRGVLEGPFTNKPEPGGLKTLPTYMVMIFSKFFVALFVQCAICKKSGLFFVTQIQCSCNSVCVIAMDYMSPDDSDLEARLNSWNLGVSPEACLRVLGSMQLSTDMKIKVLEAKHQEEKLKMQQRHDADVEKILDRKNSEIEEVKSLYRAKQKESEEMIHKLEKKVQSVLRESQVICQSKEKQIAELRKLSDQSTDSLKNEWEKKLHAAVTEMEQEKFQLQKKHTENIQELLEDTNLRLTKMESEYNARSQATEQTVRELELRVKQQSTDVEKGNALRQKVTQEKAQLEIHVASLSAELQEANRRILILQKEKEQQSEQHQQTMQKLQAKHETDMSHLHQEHDLSAAKASELIEDLEKAVSKARQQLQDSEHRRQQQVSALHGEAERERTEAKRKIARLEDALREMEGQLDRARESQRQQIQKADMALEQFKKQVELSSEKAYADMKVQMEKVEEDLVRSRSLRENQAKEFSQQLDVLRQKYEQQMAEQRMQHEQERTRLQQQHSAEKDSLVQERQREVSSLERQARAALHQHQQHTHEWRKRDAQTISDLEIQLSALREELQQVLVQHRQQLAEVALVQEEKEQRAILDKEASLDRLRSDMERIHSNLERSHQQEKDAAQEKVNTASKSMLKQIEKEFGQKLAKSAQVISFLFCPLFHFIDKLTDCLAVLPLSSQVTLVHQEYEEKIKGLMPAELRQELEDTITSLKAQVTFLQKRASLLQEDLDASRSRRSAHLDCIETDTQHPAALLCYTLLMLQMH
uniref:Centrosomal protein 112 n=1 Tax=Amphiprion percula TaxID=161767 RepID=A0A3P8SYN9_AMPPE